MKIGKNSRDIFAPTITPSVAPNMAPNASTNQKGEAPIGPSKKNRVTTSTDKLEAPSLRHAGKSAAQAPAQSEPAESHTTAENASNGRGRPVLHQEQWTKITTVLLNRHVVYLDGVSNAIRQSSGAVVKRSEILRALVEALEAADPDLEEVRSQRDLTDLLSRRLQN